MRDNTNDLGRLHGRDLIAVDKTEQAMAWLISQGPVVEHPPLPAWITKKLVAARRIMRLRRDAYLVPDASGRLPSLPRAMNLLDPSCYVSGHGALAAQGLNDQDIAVWWSVGNRRHADISYGLFRAHFVVSPESAKHGEYHVVTSDGDRVRMATPAQALVDEARLMPLGFDWIETARVLRNAVDAGQVDETELLRLLAKQPSLTATRRLGLLFDIVRGAPDQGLLAAARRNLTLTRGAGDRFVDQGWRIALPVERQRIKRGLS